MPIDATLLIDDGTGPRRVRLAEYLDAAQEESAAGDANDWIKALRHARVDGLSFRERFTYRGDSLWWFAEIYCHKERTILALFSAIYAIESLLERERPLTIRIVRGSRAVRAAVRAVAAARQVRYEGSREPGRPALRLAAMDARSAALAIAALASPRRPRRAPRLGNATVAAFVHRAFWRTDTGDGSAESYIGPVLRALEQRLPAGGIQYIGVGPPTNFRARRWWRPASAGAERVIPIETLAPRAAMRGSWRLWLSRHAARRALERSEDLRRASIIRGVDCWPVVRETLAGVALLQFPWSARAMDEAAAAFEALGADVALTYAEAGGWGRALALEARRRGVPLVGLQHGFIYRHWLNYRHEPDEMQPLGGGSADAGFPLPAITLLFDEYAARHLATAGRFPPEAIAVTGSPRLDALAAEVHRLDAAAVLRARGAAGAGAAHKLVVVVSKFGEIRAHLPGLLQAVRGMEDVRLAVKTHPAETAAPYEIAAAGLPHVTVLPASADLAALLRAADAIVTVNSTVALDALTLGVPTLTIGLPNNLSPFVTAGALAGASSADEIGPALGRVLYDRGFREQLSAAAASVAAEYRMAPDGGAAERSAAAVLALAGRKAESGKR
jgi:hypothetical protein